VSRKIYKHLIEIGKVKERKQSDKPKFKRNGTANAVNNLYKVNEMNVHKQPKNKVYNLLISIYKVTLKKRI
jgi:hypothetical protein